MSGGKTDSKGGGFHRTDGNILKPLLSGSRGLFEVTLYQMEQSRSDSANTFYNLV